jgi:TRAP-type C4-dicarboxylate transport system permease small subunit
MPSPGNASYGKDMKQAYKIEAFVTSSLEGIVTFIFFVMVVLVLLLVILRYVFATTIIGGNEATQFLFIYTTAFGAAISIGKNTHIKISVIVDRLPVRFQWAAHALNSVLIILLHAYLFYLSMQWIFSVGYFESPVLQIPQGIVQVCIPISCVFIMLYGLRQIASLFCKTKTKS